MRISCIIFIRIFKETKTRNKMKTEDFNRLKEICEKEGFEAFECYVEDTWVVQKKKDIWEGVEYAECVNSSDKNIFLKGNVYPIIKNVNDVIFSYVLGYKMDGFHIKNFKPSTEQAYIEQLKKEAFERFGEIKEGDRFENPNGGKDTRVNDPDWSYNKRYDWLYYGGCMLYKQGKWAVKLRERIEVEYTDDSWDDFEDYSEIGFVFKLPKLYDIKRGAGNFLAKQLEDYLNS